MLLNHLNKPSKLGAAGSNPAGRASFSAVSAGFRFIRLCDETGTERQRGAQCGTMTAQFQPHRRANDRLGVNPGFVRFLRLAPGKPHHSRTAVFIGGSTNWKCSHHVEQIIKTAKVFGKWVHVGRVNDPARWKHFEQLEVDSCDGTGLARYTHMRRAIAARHQQQAFI